MGFNSAFKGLQIVWSYNSSPTYTFRACTRTYVPYFLHKPYLQVTVSLTLRNTRGVEKYRLEKRDCFQTRRDTSRTVTRRSLQRIRSVTTLIKFWENNRARNVSGGGTCPSRTLQTLK